MQKSRVLLITALLLIISSSVSAQWGDDEVRNVFFDTIRTGDIRPTPIGVDEMKYIGNTYITRDDTAFMQSVTSVIQYDLDFHADFELIPLDSFFLKTYEIMELDPLGWKRLGADLLVKLDAEFAGNSMRVRWRLFDTNRQQQVAKGTIEKSKGLWRELGHEVSNEIVYRLTGERGIFLTKIAYVKQIGNAKEIFLSDYDGANERQLTNTKTINLSPSFSPNRGEIYFTSYLDGNPQLYRVNVTSGKMSKIGNFAGLVAAPAVSPDGDKIACVLSMDGNSEIYVLDLNGRIIKRLTRHTAIDTAPTWSPDGRMIAFSSDRSGAPQIYVTDPDGLNIRRLTFQGNYNDSPIWSGRGDRITFVSRTRGGRFDLASVDTSGTNFRVLTEVGMNENPHFSPDGKHIVFTSTRLGAQQQDIFAMDVSGRNQRRLTRKGNCSNPVWGPIE